MKPSLVAVVLIASLACISSASSAQQAPQTRPIDTELKLAVTPREVYELWKHRCVSGAVRMMLGEAIVRSKIGHDQFRQELTDPDPEVARHAAFTMYNAADFADIPYLRDAIILHKNNPQTVASMLSALGMLLNTPTSEFPYPVLYDKMDWCLKWLSDNEAVWKDDSYAKLWNRDVHRVFKNFRSLKAIAKLKKTPTFQKYQHGYLESEEGLAQSVMSFAFNREPETGVAISMEWIGIIRADDEVFPWMLSQFVSVLQTHAGPLVPRGTDIEKGGEQLQTALLDWWAANKDKNPTEWKMANLTTRGYQLGTPEDANLTVKECLRALASEDGIERFTAASVLADILPCGDAIIFDCRQFNMDSPNEYGAKLIDFLCADISQRAHRFLVVEQHSHNWDPQACKYVKKLDG